MCGGCGTELWCIVHLMPTVRLPCSFSLMHTADSHTHDRSYTNLIDKGLIKEVGSSNAEIEDIDLLQNGIVEGIKKPRGV